MYLIQICETPVLKFTYEALIHIKLKYKSFKISNL